MTFIATAQAQAVKAVMPVERQLNVITENLPIFGGFLGVYIVTLAVVVLYMRWEHRKDISEIRAISQAEIDRVHLKSGEEMDRYRLLMDAQILQMQAIIDSEREASKNEVNRLKNDLQNKITEAHKLDQDLRETRQNITWLISRINPRGDFGEIRELGNASPNN